MNQILSVEMPKNNTKKASRRNSGNGKASTKSVIIFFCIILLIFGIALAALGVYSYLNKETENNQIIQPTSETEKPRIDISQNASELDIEVSSQNKISKIQYKWNDGDIIEENGNGEEILSFVVNIPNGTNTFYIKVTDINGVENEYSNEYVYGGGYEEPNANLSFDEASNKLKIVCNEDIKITNIVYHYDNEQEVNTEINDTDGEVEIPIKQGEHNLTVKVMYEDGNTKQMSKKVYFPIVEKVQPTEDRNGLVLKASDKRKITKVKINFNGQDLPEEEINSETFEKTLQLQEGENRLILTVYNSDGVSITTKTRCVKNN